MRFFIAAAAIAACLPAVATAADVAVSVQVSQPGVYGRIDIGRFPQPQLVVPQPVLVVRPAVVVQQRPEPVYMWVPPGHRKNWRKHCADYNACGVPVYFVQHQWYDDHVRYGRRDKDDDHSGKGEGKGKGKGKGKHGD